MGTHIRNPLGHGATAGEIMEVLRLTGVLESHDHRRCAHAARRSGEGWPIAGSS
jgi:hypothetical protein